jgi:hypothetical protein
MSTHTMSHWPEPLMTCLVISAVPMPQTNDQIGRKHMLHEPLKSSYISSLLRHAYGVSKRAFPIAMPFVVLPVLQLLHE